MPGPSFEVTGDDRFGGSEQRRCGQLYVLRKCCRRVHIKQSEFATWNLSPITVRMAMGLCIVQRNISVTKMTKYCKKVHFIPISIVMDYFIILG